MKKITALAAGIALSIVFFAMAQGATNDYSTNHQKEESQEQPSDQATPSDQLAPTDSTLSKRNQMKLEQAEEAKKRQELINKLQGSEAPQK